MYRLDRATRALVVSLLAEGMSIRATSRVSGVSKPTVLRLLTDIGPVVAAFQGQILRDLPCERIQCDEIWGYVAMKARRVPEEQRGELGLGDIWVFTSICPDTKVVPTWLVGRRDYQTARRFILDVARRMRGRIQLTTDAAPFYEDAVWEAFTGAVDYAQLVKLYGTSPGRGPDRRYSSGECIGVRPTVVTGKPDPAHVSTSHVERANLDMRMSMRRFTRLTNGFSKKVYNLSCAVALHFMVTNFVRPHGTLTAAAYGKATTPAMAAGLETRPWTMEEVVALLEAREPTAREVAMRRKDWGTA